MDHSEELQKVSEKSSKGRTSKRSLISIWKKSSFVKRKRPANLPAFVVLIIAFSRCFLAFYAVVQASA